MNNNQDTVYYSHQFVGENNQEVIEVNPDSLTQDPNVIKSRFCEFIRNYREEKNQVYPYRIQLLERFRRKEFKLSVKLEHIANYDEQLLWFLRDQPKLYLELFESAAKDALLKTTPDYNQSVDGPIPEIQVLLNSNEVVRSIRSLCAEDVNKLIVISGIITAAHRSFSKIELQYLTCEKCGRTIRIDTRRANTESVPSKCPEEECDGENSYKLRPDYCKFIDVQTLKLQELPEAVITGDTPRSIKMTVERSLVDCVVPGTRMRITGIWKVQNRNEKRDKWANASTKNVKTSNLAVVGLDEMEDEAGRNSGIYSTPEDEQLFLDLARSPDIYEKLTRSIAPAISGDYTNDIKKAIACLLFGGTRRTLPDGMNLRGDVNMLMLGDPSTAKSQFLKFVELASPIGVYTSGKGSSSAGLTANVIKDSRGEFYLEGGAMVLADGGVVCIDEFDKMREQDRVAIHEAMEQQTISIAKAGITTVLNARNSVLAAANPVYGTYNDMKSAAENIDFLPSILSRFDMIFIVRDIRDPEKDRTIARHVLSVHINASTYRRSVQNPDAKIDDAAEIDLVTLKKYIRYCRQKCAPVLSKQGAEVLSNHYVSMRQEYQKKNFQNSSLGGKSVTGRRKDRSANVIPLTVRQLEAVIRIAESLAKMELEKQVSVNHVSEAIRLFKVSTLSAASYSAIPGDLSGLDPSHAKEVQEAEQLMLQRVPRDQTIERRRIITEFVDYHRFSGFAVEKALQILVARGVFKYLLQQRLVKRVKAG